MAGVVALAALALCLAGPGCGKGGSKPRLYVIGLDGATFDLLQPWLDRGDLPTLKSVIDGGVSGELRSVYPILSPVAWTSMFTGTNPGKHGIYDFERPDPDAPERGIFYTSENRRAAAVWTLLNDAGLSTAVLNVPMTWPPDQVNGVMVSGFPFPSKGTFTWTWPKELQGTLGNYPLDPMGEALIPGSEGAMLASLVESRDAVARVTLDWVRTRHEDFTFSVFTATDRVQHFFWSMMDPRHPYHTEALNQAYGEAMHEFWKTLDARLAGIIAALPPDATLIILSDHGFGPVYREVNTINWFKSTPLNEYAKTHQVPDLYATNGIFRYRLGTRWPMNPEYETFRSMFIKEATSLVDPKTGQHPIARVQKREELFAGRQVPRAPDLVLIEAPDYYIGAGDLSRDLDPVTDLHSTSYGAYHRPNGIFVIRGPHVRTGRLQGASLLDMAPTILHVMGQPVPVEMDGRVLEAVFDPQWLTRNRPRYVEGSKILEAPPERQLSEEEREQLEAVPYIM